MKIRFDPRAEKFLKKLGGREKSKVYEYLALFDEYGFGLDTRYLRKVTKVVWELRPGKIRLFIIRVSGQSVLMHAMFKKSQKITRETAKILKGRVKEYL